MPPSSEAQCMTSFQPLMAVELKQAACNCIGVNRYLPMYFGEFFNFFWNCRNFEISMDIVVTNNPVHLSGFQLNKKKPFHKHNMVGCCHIRCKSPGSYPRLGIKTQYEKKNFFGDFFSTDFWQKL